MDRVCPWSQIWPRSPSPSQRALTQSQGEQLLRLKGMVVICQCDDGSAAAPGSPADAKRGGYRRRLFTINGVGCDISGAFSGPAEDVVHQGPRHHRGGESRASSAALRRPDATPVTGGGRGGMGGGRGGMSFRPADFCDDADCADADCTALNHPDTAAETGGGRGGEREGGRRGQRAEEQEVCGAAGAAGEAGGRPQRLSAAASTLVAIGRGAPNAAGFLGGLQESFRACRCSCPR